MYKHTPKEINVVYGYRTSRSMKNEETWKFAHDCCGRLWFKLGFILIIPTIVAMLPFAKSNETVVGIVTLIVISFQVIVLIGSIFPVESALKKNFDDNGNRM
jgi:uncharacterized membrane protein